MTLTTVATGLEPEQILLSTARAAYFKKDYARTHELAQALLSLLGEDPRANNPRVASAAYMLRGWALLGYAKLYWHKQNKTGYWLFLRNAETDFDNALTEVLLDEEAFLERVTIEGYLAYVRCRLGKEDAVERHLDYLRAALSGRTNNDAVTIFNTVSAMIDRFRNGEPAPIEEVAPEIAEQSPVDLASSEATYRPRGLKPEVAEELAQAMERQDAVKALEMTQHLLDTEPEDVGFKAWRTLRAAHIWALLTPLKTGGKDSSQEYEVYMTAVPFMAQLADEPFVRRYDPVTYVDTALELVYALHLLGLRDEVKEYWIDVCRFIHETDHPDRHLMQQKQRDTQDRIAVIYRAFGSRPLVG